MKKLLLFLAILFAIISAAKSQDTTAIYYPWTSKMLYDSTAYYEIYKKTRDYFETLPDSVYKKEKKIFNRADWFWNGRTATSDTNFNGTLTAYNKAMLENIYDYEVCSGNHNNSNWNFLGPYLWENMNGNGIVTAVWTDPQNQNLIYAGTNASGLWKTTDGGNTWACKTDVLRLPGMGIQWICVDRNNNQRLLAATGISTYGRSYGIGVLRDTNGGNDITLSNFPVTLGDNMVVTKIIQHPTNYDEVYAIARNNIYKSTDFGANWTLFKTVPTTLEKMELCDIELTLNSNVLKIYVSSKDKDATAGGAEMWVYNCSTDSFTRIDENTTNFDWIKDGSFESFNGSCWNCLFLARSPSYDDTWSIIENGGNKYINCTTCTSGYILTWMPDMAAGGTYTLSYNISIPVGCTVQVVAFDTDDDPNAEQEIKTYTNNTQNPLIVNENLIYIPDKSYTKIRFNITNNNDNFTLDNLHYYLNDNRKEIIGISVPNSTNDEVWAYIDIVGDGFSQVIDKTTNGGNSWVNIIEKFKADADFFDMVFEVSPYNNNLIYAGGVNLYTIENGICGSSIAGGKPVGTACNSAFTTHCDIRSLQIAGNYYNSDILLIGDDGGVAKRYNGTWTSINGNSANINERLNITQIYGSGISEQKQKYLCGAQDNGTYIFDNDLQNCKWLFLWGGDGGQSIINYNDADLVYGLENQFIYSTQFPSHYGCPENDIGWRLNMPFLMDPLEENTFYFGNYNVYRSSNIQYENLWYTISDNAPHAVHVSAIGVSQNIINGKSTLCFSDGFPSSWEQNNGTPLNPDRNKKLYITYDDGDNWEDITNGNLCNAIEFSAITDIVFDPYDYDNSTIWVSLDQIRINENATKPYNGEYRVMKTINAGTSWTDMSSGLPCVPVNKIVYQLGTDEGLYAGTDVGVFIWNKTTQAWECFCNNDLPVAIITDLDIDYCRGKLVASTFGRGLWETDLYNFSQKEKIITSNETWDNERFERNDILVQSGTLTLSSTCKVKLSKDRRIVVYPGAKLLIDGGVVTGYCSDLWQGIELRGDDNESQLTQGAQGEVEIINGGTIENALCGIYVGERDGNGNLLPGTGGGIVKATGGVFKNCVEAVHYTPYINFNPNDQNHPEIINTGYFTDCTFETDDDYYGMTSMQPKSFFTLEGIKGLRLKGNTFQNTADDAIPAQERGKGITSVDAMYYLYPGCTTSTYPCPQPDPNVFEKLHYGIYAANIKPLIPIFVKDNVFTDNFRAIRITGMEGAVITGNNFDIGANLGPISPYSFGIDAYGIHLEGCSGYQIQENNFETDDDGRYGIIISNSGIKANLLNNNTFNGLLIACQAEGINGSTPYYGANVGNINAGLIFKCNEYSGNTVTDISVTSGLIDVEQGLCTDTYSPAGNTFANHGTLGNLWANSWVTPYTYNYHGAEVTTPYVINPIAAVHSCDISYSSQSCALPYGNYTIQELQQIINTNVTALSGMKRKIDGGNTQNVLDYIDTKPDGEDLRYLLTEQLAPYVSDEVLIKTIFYHDTISDAQLADVIVANSPVTEIVMDFLNKINLDGNSREIIINAQTGISARFLLEDSINNAQTALDYASNEMVSIYMSDTTLTGAINIADFYNEGEDTTNYLKIIAAEAFLIAGERERAQNVIDVIESEDPEITNSVEYLSILCDTNNVWDTVVTLTTAQLQSLESIAQSGTRVAYNAKTLLEIALDTIYDEVIESIEIADSLTISGHLHESSNCSNNAVAGDTLLIKSPQGMVYTKVSPVVTDSNGYFKFNPMELSLINDTVEFTISTKNSFSVDAAGTGTRADWIGQSPLHLTLEKLYRSWKYDFENVQEMMTVSKSVALADQVYVAGSIYNPSTENIDAVLLKLDTAGNMLWNVYYEGEGGDNKVMDFYVDDSLKIYLLLFTEVENEPLTEIVVYDSSGNLKWNVQSEDIKVGKQIIGNNDGYIYVGGDNSVSDNQYCYVYRYTETGSVDWYTSFEVSNTPFEFVALAMLNDTTILSACVDLYSNTTYVYANKADDGTAENEFSLGDFKAVDLLSDDGSIYLSGNGALGGLVLTQKINAGYEIEWSAGEESDLIYTTPGCLAKDTKGNISVLYYDNVGFGITSYDADGYENWSVSESGDWYSEIEKLSLKTDEEGNLYTLLASNNFEQGGLRSYIYKHNTSGEKQWEQFFEYTRLYDFALSENGNIYTSGSLFFAENEYSLSIYKYAQCYITANLRSAADSTNTENLSETYVKLYPNPNDGSMQVEYLLPENQKGIFELYDLTGRKVYSLALQESSGVESISAHNLTRGVYMYRVVSGDKTVDMGKVVVIK